MMCEDVKDANIAVDVGIGNNDKKFLGLTLIPREKVIVTKKLPKQRSYKVISQEKEELERFALMAINNRIEFCKKYKTGEEEIGKCVCESVRRYLRLSRESASRAISKKQVNAIKKLFEEMRKEGKIKCQDTL